MVNHFPIYIKYPILKLYVDIFTYNLLYASAIVSNKSQLYIVYRLGWKVNPFDLIKNGD
jgi:hypothetical protein